MSFRPSATEIRRTEVRRREAEYFKRFASDHFTGRPEKLYLDEAYKSYTGNAFGATAVYCGLALEAFLYERVKQSLPQNWTVDDLLRTAVNEGIISNVSPGHNQVSELEASRYIFAVRDVHAHHIAGLRPRTMSRFQQVRASWGQAIPSWFNELQGVAGVETTVNTLDQYGRAMASDIMRRTVGIVQVILTRHT